MATISFVYTEGEAEGLPHEQTVVLKRTNSNDLYDALDFIGQALRAAGFSYVDRVGVATERGEEKWSRF